MQLEKALQLTSQANQENSLKDAEYTWQNELGSTMTFALSNQQISGTYQSTVGSNGPIEGPLIGWLSGNTIGFSVNWSNGKVTTWTGHVMFENGNLAIESLWQMGVKIQNPSDPDELWDSLFAGTDRFVLTTP